MQGEHAERSAPSANSSRSEPSADHPEQGAADMAGSSVSSRDAMAAVQAGLSIFDYLRANKDRFGLIKAEVQGLISFAAVVFELFTDSGISLFLLLGLGLIVLDLYFTRALFRGEANRSVRIAFLKTTHDLSKWDDILSDLPQAIWIAIYMMFYKFSLVGMVQGVYAAFQLANDALGLELPTTFKLPSSVYQ